MKFKNKNMILFLILVLNVILSPLETFAATVPSGPKTFAAVGASNSGYWDDGVPLGGS